MSSAPMSKELRDKWLLAITGLAVFAKQKESVKPWFTALAPVLNTQNGLVEERLQTLTTTNPTILQDLLKLSELRGETQDVALANKPLLESIQNTLKGLPIVRSGSVETRQDFLEGLDEFKKSVATPVLEKSVPTQPATEAVKPPVKTTPETTVTTPIATETTEESVARLTVKAAQEAAVGTSPTIKAVEPEVVPKVDVKPKTVDKTVKAQKKKKVDRAEAGPGAMTTTIRGGNNDGLLGAYKPIAKETMIINNVRLFSMPSDINMYADNAIYEDVFIRTRGAYAFRSKHSRNVIVLTLPIPINPASDEISETIRNDYTKVLKQLNRHPFCFIQSTRIRSYVGDTGNDSRFMMFGVQSLKVTHDMSVPDVIFATITLMYHNYRNYSSELFLTDASGEEFVPESSLNFVGSEFQRFFDLLSDDEIMKESKQGRIEKFTTKDFLKTYPNPDSGPFTTATSFLGRIDLLSPSLVVSKDKIFPELLPGQVEEKYNKFKVLKQITTPPTLGTRDATYKAFTKANGIIEEVGIGASPNVDGSVASPDDPVFEDAKMYYVNDKGLTFAVGGTSVQRISASRSNSFASQFIGGFKHPTLQYVGKLPGKVEMQFVNDCKFTYELRGKRADTGVAGSGSNTEIHTLLYNLLDANNLSFPEAAAYNFFKIYSYATSLLDIEDLYPEQASISASAMSSDIESMSMSFTEASMLDFIDYATIEDAVEETPPTLKLSAVLGTYAQGLYNRVEPLEGSGEQHERILNLITSLDAALNFEFASPQRVRIEGSEGETAFNIVNGYELDHEEYKYIIDSIKKFNASETIDDLAGADLWGMYAPYTRDIEDNLEEEQRRTEEPITKGEVEKVRTATGEQIKAFGYFIGTSVYRKLYVREQLLEGKEPRSSFASVKNAAGNPLTSVRDAFKRNHAVDSLIAQIYSAIRAFGTKGYKGFEGLGYAPADKDLNDFYLYRKKGENFRDMFLDKAFPEGSVMPNRTSNPELGELIPVDRRDITPFFYIAGQPYATGEQFKTVLSEVTAHETELHADLSDNITHTVFKSNGEGKGAKLAYMFENNMFELRYKRFRTASPETLWQKYGDTAISLAVGSAAYLLTRKKGVAIAAGLGSTALLESYDVAMAAGEGRDIALAEWASKNKDAILGAGLIVAGGIITYATAGVASGVGFGLASNGARLLIAGGVGVGFNAINQGQAIVQANGVTGFTTTLADLKDKPKYAKVTQWKGSAQKSVQLQGYEFENAVQQRIERLLPTFQAAYPNANPVDIQLMVAQQLQESKGNPATGDSGAGAQGIAQIVPVGRQDIRENSGPQEAGTYNKNDLSKQADADTLGQMWFMYVRIPQILESEGHKPPYSNEILLAAYNWGSGSTSKYLKSQGGKRTTPVEITEETKEYVAAITAIRNHRVDTLGLNMALDKTNKEIQDRGAEITADPTLVRTNKLQPVKSNTPFKVTSLFSRNRKGRRHQGVDIAAPEGTPVVAAAFGTVEYVGEKTGYGKVVVITHPIGVTTVYAHLKSQSVNQNAIVNYGDTIGLSGDSGSKGSFHLHYEVRLNGTDQEWLNRYAINPHRTTPLDLIPIQNGPIIGQYLAENADIGEDGVEDFAPRRNKLQEKRTLQSVLLSMEGSSQIYYTNPTFPTSSGPTTVRYNQFIKGPGASVHDPNLMAEKHTDVMFHNMRYGLDTAFPIIKAYVSFGLDDYLTGTEVIPTPVYKEIYGLQNITLQCNDDTSPVDVLRATVANPSFFQSGITGGLVQMISQDPAAIMTADFASFKGNKIRLKAGMKLQVRAGYGNNPNHLETIFNGVVTDVSGQKSLTLDIIAESFGRELLSKTYGAGGNVESVTGISNAATGYTIGRVLLEESISHFGRSVYGFKKFIDLNNYDGSYGDSRDPESKALISESLYDEASLLTLFSAVKYPQRRFMNIYSAEIEETHTVYSTNIQEFLGRAINVAFRAISLRFFAYNLTPWGVLKQMEHRHPGTVAKPLYYEDGCTMFYGLKEQLYIARDLAPGYMAVMGALLTSDKEYFDTSGGDVGEKDAETTVTGSDGRVVNVQTSTKDEQIAAEYLTERKKRLKPATGYHLFNSRMNIISNGLSITNNYSTKVSVSWMDEKSGVKPEENPDGVSEVYLDDNLFPYEIREKQIKMGGCHDQYMSWMYGAQELKRELETMYGGKIIVIGDPTIKAGDYAYLDDMDRDMKGTIKIRECTHHFNGRDGYVTEIVPGAFVEVSSFMWSTFFLKMHYAAMHTSNVINFGSTFANTGGELYTAYNSMLQLVARRNRNKSYGAEIAHGDFTAVVGTAVGAAGGLILYGMVANLDIGKRSAKLLNPASGTLARHLVNTVVDAAGTARSNITEILKAGFVDNFKGNFGGDNVTLGNIAKGLTYRGAARTMYVPFKLVLNFGTLKLFGNMVLSFARGARGVLGALGPGGWLAAAAFELSTSVFTGVLTEDQLVRQPLVLHALNYQGVPYVAGMNGLVDNTYYESLQESWKRNMISIKGSLDKAKYTRGAFSGIAETLIDTFNLDNTIQQIETPLGGNR